MFLVHRTPNLGSSDDFRPLQRQHARHRWSESLHHLDMQLAKVKVKTSQQGTLAFCGRRIPAQGGVPPYKSWSYLMRNEQANEIGGRVFYTDATGAEHAIKPLLCRTLLRTQRA